jgi:hypothetical protein
VNSRPYRGPLNWESSGPLPRGGRCCRFDCSSKSQANVIEPRLQTRVGGPRAEVPRIWRGPVDAFHVEGGSDETRAEGSELGGT